MARTKQTARRSTGGKAPRKQLATKAKRQSFQQYFQSQQAVGAGAVGEIANRQKSNFMNTEVAFDCFSFSIPDGSPPTAAFAPRMSSCCVDGEHMLGLSFPSSLDGPGMALGRQDVTLQLSIVLDISGSMGCRMPDDEASESKLEVAKSSIVSILRQLAPSDHVSITLFDHNQQLLVPLQPVSTLDLPKTEKMVQQLRPCGGTRLSEGFNAGASVLQGASPARSVKRVIFLTDMQSGPADEAAVLAGLRHEAEQHQSYTTVLGIGVDLSMAAVQQISSTPGGRYISVAIAEEFERRLATEFVHDTIPVAFQIQVTLLDGCQIARTAGHPELAGLAPGSSSFKLSSEFASADPENTGMIMLQLQPSAPSTARTRKHFRAQLRWLGLDGKEHEWLLSTPRLPEDSGESLYGCPSLQKAVAVWQWVRMLDEYVMDDSSADPAERARSAQAWVKRFQEFKPVFEQHLERSGDLSLGSSNINFVQTLDQMINTEQAELAAAHTHLGGHPVPAGCPPDFLCPISHALMLDPVIAADGHSYERAQLCTWLSGHGTSPKTGAALSSTQLIPNHTLKAAIQSFLEEHPPSTPPKGNPPKVHRARKSAVLCPKAKTPKAKTPKARAPKAAGQAPRSAPVRRSTRSSTRIQA